MTLLSRERVLLPLSVFISREERRSCLISVAVIVTDHAVRGVIENLSTNGARLTLDTIVRIHPGQELEFSCAELGHIRGIVRWSTHPSYGIEFDTHSKASGRVRSLYAALSSPLQPPSPSNTKGAQ